MTGLRSYGDACGIARALDLVGERWALLIVRELLFGPKRFTDLKAGLRRASPNVLSQRLRELEAGGVVQRRRSGGALYELSESGRALHPILLDLGRWGARSPAARGAELSLDALMVALEATFLPSKAGELDARYELRLGEERFTVTIQRGTIAIARAAFPRADAVIEATPATLRGLVFGDTKLAGAAAKLSGDTRLARAFFGLFARPSASSPAHG